MHRIAMLIVCSGMFVSAAYCNATGRVRYLREADGGTVDSLCYSATDSVLAIKFDTCYGGEIPPAFPSAYVALDSQYVPWAYAPDFFVFGIDESWDFESAQASLDTAAAVLIVNPVVEWRPGGFAYFRDDVLAFFKPDVDGGEIDSIKTALGLEVVSSDSVCARLQTLRKMESDSLDILETANALVTSGLVHFAQADFWCTGCTGCLPNDPLFPDQWYLRNALEPVHSIDADSAWEISKGSPRISIAFFDNGYDLYTHRDLTLPAPGLQIFEPYDPAGDEKDYYLDCDFDPSPPCTDDNFVCSHGTAAMGMVYAQMDNAIGLAGLAPQCHFTPVKLIADDAAGADAHDWRDFVEGQKHVLRLWRSRHDNPSDPIVPIISCQLFKFGEGSLETAYFDTLYSEGVLCINSAGNWGWVEYPASLPSVRAVAHINASDTRIPLESALGENLDYTAPGFNVRVLDLPGPLGENTGETPSGDYKWVDGSSFAAPLVAGTAALVYARRPDLIPESGPPTAIIAILDRSCEDEVGDPDDDVPGWDEFYGHGRINPFRALVSVSRGDFNHDGTIDVADLAATIAQLNGGSEPELHPGLSDCDCSGDISDGDTTAIVDHIIDDEPPPDTCFTYDYGGGE